MCPKCLSKDWTLIDNNFLCDGCGELHAVCEMVACSDYYVYCFISDDWGVPFYVGKGTKERYRRTAGRSEHIKAICSKNKWHPEIIKYCTTEEDAFDYEKQIKKEYKKLGYPIIDGESSAIRANNQRAGIIRAKESGRKFGRPQVQYPDNWDSVIKQWRSGKITATKAMELTGVKRTTFYKLVNSSEDVLA